MEDVPWECSKALIILKQGYQVRQENIFGSDYAFLEPDITLDCTAEVYVFFPGSAQVPYNFFRPAGFYFFLATFHHRRETLLAKTELKLSCSGINRYNY